jgi:CO/xanthine dehydrogenase Mo-binding subunit
MCKQFEASPMKSPATSAQELELRQHEAIRHLVHVFELDRRDFVKLFGGGLLLCLCAHGASPQESGGLHRGEDLPQSIDAWLHIGEDGAVTVYTGKVEMGQNIRTSLAQQVAEELLVPVAAISLVMGDTDLTPFDMGTFGSRTTPYMGPVLRRAAASARRVLLQRAAEQWQTDPSKLSVADGKVTNNVTKQTLYYGELAKGQKLVALLSSDIALEPPQEWRIAGREQPKVEGRDFVTGRHQYASDISRPGMLHGKILRPTAFDATLASLDTSDLTKEPNTTVVHDGNFVGVAAPSRSAAERARASIRAKWSVKPEISESELFEYLRKNSKADDDSRHVIGSLEQGYASAAKTVSSTYTVAYIAHTPLEPRAAVAEWTGDKLTVWTGTQRPFAVKTELAQAFHIQTQQVRVIVPDTGSAYGGKHTGETAIEAARLAKAAGRPVKLVWTREEEFTWAYFRPAGVIDVKGGVSAGGALLAWEFDNYNSGPAAIKTPYSVPNQRIQFHSVESPLRQGSYRGLAATANHFARESHMDELAHGIHLDPLEFRLKNIGDPRLRAVFEAAAQKFGWGREKSSSTRGFGIAGGVEKGGYTAVCTEVAIADHDIKIERVTAAWESGAVVNSDGLQNQVSGSVMMALGGALFEAIHFSNGRILNPHLANYRVPRFSDMPKIEIDILDRKDLPPAGAGETAIVGLAPAVGNAIFAATGIRLRSLPMVPDGLPSKAQTTT